MTKRLFSSIAIVAGIVLVGCSSTPQGATNTVAFIPDYQPGGGATKVVPQGYTAATQPIVVSLGETDSTHMFIDLSQSFAPAGKVSFIITNTGKQAHEMVVLQTDTMAADFPITGFEGDPNRFDEDAKGLTNVGETGDPAMEPGTSKMLTIDNMASGHYAIVCNLPGHYGMGMHQDFWVTPAGSTAVTASLGETDSTHMFIDLSQSFAPAGKVSFIITNTGKQAHEMVVLQTDTMAADFPITGFEGDPNRFDEDAKGLTNVGETGDPAMEPGTSKMLTIDNMASGHYAIVCNLPGHYGMGMHQDFWVTPAGSTAVTASLGETDSTHMFIDLSQSFAPAGKVSFIITNTGKQAHEMVVLQTDTMAADFPITGFEGDPNRFDEDAKGLTNVGETGDPAMEPGTSKMLTIDNMASGHYAIVCNLPGHYGMGMHQDFWVTPAGSTAVTASLGETDSTHMFIDLSQSFAPAGKVSFIITNTGKQAHEMVVLQTDTMAADFPITGFEGDPNRFDEDAKGLTNVGETGDPAMEPGTSKMLTIDNMASGHYAIVCNLPGHYGMGMHQDFWVTPAGSTAVTASLGETDSTHMFIDLSQSFAPAGKVSFIITNTGKQAHEMVVLQTDTMAADFPITGFEGDPNRFDEDAKGLTNVGETGDPAMEPGTSKMLTIDNMASGHYAIVCNLPGHYGMGMHQDFWVTPAPV